MEIREKEIQEIEARMFTLLCNGKDYRKVINNASKVRVILRKVKRRNGQGRNKV